MKKTWGLPLVLFIITATLSACVNGKGDVVIKTYDVSGFSKIDHGVKGDVILVNDVNQYVEVHAQENILDILKIENDGNTLKIRTKSGKSIGKYEELTYYVHTPLIDQVTIGGKGTVTGSDITGTGNFTCKLSADGQLKLDEMDATNVEVVISGAGSVTLNGTADYSDLGVGSAGTIDCYGLTSKECRAELKGNGIIRTYVQNKFTVYITGSGTIYYKGDPTLDKHINGSGILVHQQ